MLIKKKHVLKNYCHLKLSRAVSRAENVERELYCKTLNKCEGEGELTLNILIFYEFSCNDPSQTQSSKNLYHNPKKLSVWDV